MPGVNRRFCRFLRKRSARHAVNKPGAGERLFGVNGWRTFVRFRTKVCALPATCFAFAAFASSGAGERLPGVNRSFCRFLRKLPRLSRHQAAARKVPICPATRRSRFRVLPDCRKLLSHFAGLASGCTAGARTRERIADVPVNTARSEAQPADIILAVVRLQSDSFRVAWAK